MERSLILMMAALKGVFTDETMSVEDSPGVVLLDFAKAYDTVDRSYMLMVLQKFGFTQDFVDLIERQHRNTTAQFLVNGQLSSKMPVRTSIRQGCPLAPLLFILVAETLSLTIQQDPQLHGIKVRPHPGYAHVVGAYVDDTNVMLSSGSELERLLELLLSFGRMSGLHVQPSKSVFISLNSYHLRQELFGVNILPHGQTTRCLGVQVGTGPWKPIGLTDAVN